MRTSGRSARQGVEDHQPDARAMPGRPKVVRGFWGMLRPYRRRALLALLVLLGTVATTLAGPALVRYAIDDGLVIHHSMAVVDIAAAAYLVTAIVGFLLSRAQTRLVSSVGERMLNDLRVRVFDHLLAQPLSFFDSQPAGQLLSRMTADIDVLETLVQSGLGTLVTSVALLVLSAGVLVLMSPLLFAATLACLPPALFAAARYRGASTRAYAAVRERIGDTLVALDEGLAGVRVVQAFNRQRHQAALFEGRSDAQLSAELKAVRLSALFFPKVEGSGVVATAVILLLGAVLVHAGLASIGTVAAFVLYVANLFDSIQNLSQLFDLLQSSGAALATIFTLLEVVPGMVDPARPESLPSSGSLELSAVGFSYSAEQPSEQERPALSGVNFSLRPGEHVTLVGPTGAGKSTLAKLIGRLYDPDAGAIRFGGVDLRRASVVSLRRAIVVVPQEGFLFRGTVMENILVGRPGATEEEASQAVEALGLSERMAAFPRGLRTEVGERGSHLSAGERQLVSLSRAALADPAVLVMDEATSSLDPGTEALVERALGALTEGRTTITVAHRLSTAERADRVAVVVDGYLVEIGSHDELVDAGGAYADLFASWAGRASVKEAD